MPIVPDTKDWTWVLERACPECGLDPQALPRASVAPMLRDNARAWHAVLTGATPVRGTTVVARPADDVWSALEYGCHVRDVFRLYDQRLRLMLEQDDPQFPNWDQDATALADRYDEQDPAAVADELVAASAVLAADLERVDEGDWERTGNRSDGARFTIESFARYLIHDPVHHLYDVTAVRATPQP